MPRKTRKDYPPDWEEISRRTKERYGWKCAHCGLQFSPKDRKVRDTNGKWQTFGVHHLDRDTSNNSPDNLVALCSACHCRAEWPLIRRELWERRERDTGQLRLPFDST